MFQVSNRYMEFLNRDGRLENNFILLKILYEVNGKTIWPNREIPQKTLKTLGSVVKN